MSFERCLGRYALGAMVALAMLLAASTSRADTAVSACGTLAAAGNYFLTKDLTAAGTCIVIGDDGVSFDMKGHTITGNGSGDGITDGGSTFRSMAIANGSIRNFDIGIALETTCCLAMRNVDSSKNTETGILIGHCCAALDAVTANNNGAVGVLIAEFGSTLNNIQANSNGAGGIVTAGCCTTIANSSVSGNTGAGIVESGCCSFLVSSTVNKSTHDGVDMNDGFNFVVGSTVTDNGNAGVSLVGNFNLVTGAQVSGNGHDGIFLSSFFNQITSSKSTKNGGFGANVGCPGAITGLTAKNNTGSSLNTFGGSCTQLNNTL